MSPTVDNFRSILSAVGLRAGDAVLLHSDMRYLVELASAEELKGQADPKNFLLSSFDRALVETVGPEGTICVLGSFTDYARFGKPFILEETPPDQRFGAYNAWLFRQKTWHRSLNPIVGFLAKGAKAAWICEHFSAYGYGPNTPWDRLVQLDGKMLFWGVDMRVATFVHHAEQLMGVPQLYHKLYSAPVIANGKPINLPVITNVRYLDFNIWYRLDRLQQDLASAGLLTEFHQPPFEAYSMRCRPVLEHILNRLASDPYYLLGQTPDFVAGRIPTDGNTGPRTQPDYGTRY